MSGAFRSNGAGGPSAANVASLASAIIRDVPPSLLLQLHYLCQEPDVIELAWRIACLPAGVRARLQAFLAEATDLGELVATRDLDALTLKPSRKTDQP